MLHISIPLQIVGVSSSAAEQKAVKATISCPLDGQDLASVAVPGTGAAHCWPGVQVGIPWKLVKTAVSIRMIWPLHSGEKDFSDDLPDGGGEISRHSRGFREEYSGGIACFQTV